MGVRRRRSVRVFGVVDSALASAWTWVRVVNRRAGTSATIGYRSASSVALCVGQPAAAVASTACRMSCVAASGWDTNETCEAATSTIVALARSAMNRWQLRWDRLVLGTEQIPARQRLPRWWGRRRGGERSDGVGPLRHGHHCGRLRIDVGREGFTERLLGEVEIGALAPVGIGERNRPDRRPDKAAFELFEKLLLALAHVAHPAVDVDERLDLLVADRGDRDHVAAVGVADEHDRPAQGPQELGQIRGIASEIAEAGCRTRRRSTRRPAGHGSRRRSQSRRPTHREPGRSTGSQQPFSSPLLP